MTKDTQLIPVSWPAFAGENSVNTIGQSGHGHVLDLNNPVNPEFLLLNFCTDNTRPQANPPPQVVKSNERAYAAPILTAQLLGVSLTVHRKEGTRRAWPPCLPPFGWN